MYVILGCLSQSFTLVFLSLYWIWSSLIELDWVSVLGASTQTNITTQLFGFLVFQASLCPCLCSHTGIELCLRHLPPVPSTLPLDHSPGSSPWHCSFLFFFFFFLRQNLTKLLGLLASNYSSFCLYLLSG